MEVCDTSGGSLYESSSLMRSSGQYIILAGMLQSLGFGVVA